jgi:hypothetical protein
MRSVPLVLAEIRWQSRHVFDVRRGLRGHLFHTLLYAASTPGLLSVVGSSFMRLAFSLLKLIMSIHDWVRSFSFSIQFVILLPIISFFDLEIV